MIHQAIKDYLHKSAITSSEVELIKELLKDGKETLKDFLPKDKKSYFLPNLLRASLVNYKDNKEFIDDIISLRNKDNKDSLYSQLKYHKYGLEIIKNNPTLFDDDLNEAFKNLLYNGSSKPILEFINNNKEKINTDLIYNYCLDVSLIPSLEKIGLTFDDRIIDVVVNEKNYKKPDKLLKYIEKFEPTCDEQIWNNSIIRMLRYYNRQIWDDYGKYKIADSFSLITKLKNPGQYKWGQELKNYNYFSFPDSLRAFFSNRKLHGYLDNKNPASLEVAKEFIKNNDIYFTNLKNDILVFWAFIDDFSDAVLEKTIKDNWSEMFRFKEMEEVRRNRNKGLHRDTAIFDNLRAEKQSENSVLQNERFRKIVLKEYFSNKKYRLEDYAEDTFFTALGVGTEDIIGNSALSRYSDILTKENVEYIFDSLGLKGKVRQAALLSYEMMKADDFTKAKKKQLKV